MGYPICDIEVEFIQGQLKVPVHATTHSTMLRGVKKVRHEVSDEWQVDSEDAASGPLTSHVTSPLTRHGPVNSCPFALQMREN